MTAMRYGVRSATVLSAVGSTRSLRGFVESESAVRQVQEALQEAYGDEIPCHLEAPLRSPGSKSAVLKSLLHTGRVRLVGHVCRSPAGFAAKLS